MVQTIKKRHSNVDDVVKSMHLGRSTGTRSHSILLLEGLSNVTEYIKKHPLRKSTACSQ